MSHIFGCKQTPPTPPTTSDEESSGSSDDAEMKKQKGNRAMGKKKYPKAIKYYSRAIKIDPENATYRLNRAIANSALELWKDAETDASSALELGDPPSAKGHYQLVRARLRRGNVAEAREALDIALASCPNEAALTQLSREVERAEVQQEARRRKAVEAQAQKPQQSAGPSGGRALLEQAHAAYKAGSMEKAVSLCQQARDAVAAHRAAGPVNDAAEGRQAEEIGICGLLGKANMQLRRWADAAEAFREVVKLEEKVAGKDLAQREALSTSYNNLGIACKNAGQMREAVEALNSAYLQATNGDDKVATVQAAQVLQNLAQCLRAEKKVGEARQMYNRAMEIGQRLHGPDHASHALNHMCIARCFREEGQLKEAMESYTKAMEIWMHKEPEVCLKEMPEVPNQDRLQQLQQQCKGELAQLVLMAEQLRAQAQAGEGEGTAANSSQS